MFRYFYFLNRRNSGEGFRESVNSRFFVDKSMLIDEINQKIATKEKWICVSKPRRFGKTMALEMLAAYFTKGIQTDELFDGLKIKDTISYYKHLNAHNVICINFNEYFEEHDAQEGIRLLSERLIRDLKQAYPNVIGEEKNVSLCLDMVGQVIGEKFIFLIDEWDCLFRIHKGKKQDQEEFLSFLRGLFKDKSYVELVYMTGILPIKKYNTGSALNMFREYTMLDPKKLGGYFGFTEEETQELCRNGCSVTFEELKLWYDGYHVPGSGDIFNPRSVVEALEESVCKDYWNKTGGFSELEEYITMDFDGLGSMITELVAGNECAVNVLGFSNDLDSFQDRDEVLTALIHLGYLTCRDGKVWIPNKEIREEFANTIKKLSWGIVSKLLNQSRALLRAVLDKDEEKVASMLEDVHDGMQEFKEYNSEHTLKCVIHLAFYAAQDDYILYFEKQAGKGYVDCIMEPRRMKLPGIVIELKYDQSVEAAIEQIEKKNYVKGFDRRVRKVFMVGINYNKKEKKHQCKIVEVDRNMQR